MSFDWLNIPGLDIQNESNDQQQTGSAAPPSVSFDFGPTPGSQSFDGIMNKPMNTGSKNPFGKQPQQTNNNLTVSNNNANNLNVPIANGNSLTSSTSSVAELDASSDNNSGVDDGYTETPDDLRVPLSLSQSQLTHEEIRTYLRWYKYITTRTHGKLVRLIDVFKFLHNFNITEELKRRLLAIFRSCKNALNIGQFFAVVRLISTALIKGVLPLRGMILMKAPVPKPRPILSSEGSSEVYEEVDDDEDDDPNNKTNQSGNGSKVDFDSFTSLLLTGQSRRKKVRRRITNAVYRSKKVRFSEHITFQDPPSSDQRIQKHELAEFEELERDEIVPQGPLDLTLPMDQLLKQMAKRKNTSLVSKLPTEQQETEEEKEELKDMQDSLSHFKNIRGVDSAALGIPLTPTYLTNSNVNGSGLTQSQIPLQPLKPTSTGSANHFMRQEFNDNYNPQQVNQSTILQPLKPTATGSANYLMKNQFEPQTQADHHSQSFSAPSNTSTINTPNIVSQGPIGIAPLKPTATGSANYLMKQHQAPATTTTINASSQAKDNTFQVSQGGSTFMNFPQQQQQQQQQQPDHFQLIQQPVLSPRVSLSEQNNIPTPAPLTQQNTYPLNAQHNNNHYQASPQVTGGNQNLGVTTSALPNTVPYQNLAASNYFQALLTHSNSPSPNTSSSNVNLNSGTNGYSNLGSNAANGSRQPLYHHNSDGNVNPYNDYPQQRQQTVIQNQQSVPSAQYYGNVNGIQQNANSVQGVQHPNSAQGMQHLGANQFYNSNPAQNTHTGQQPEQNDYLSNYQGMQQQVNSLQNMYGRR